MDNDLGYIMDVLLASDSKQDGIKQKLRKFKVGVITILEVIL